MIIKRASISTACSLACCLINVTNSPGFPCPAKRCATCYSRTILVLHFGHASEVQGCPATCGCLCPQLGHTQYPLGPAALGPPMRPRPPPFPAPYPRPRPMILISFLTSAATPAIGARRPFTTLLPATAGMACRPALSSAHRCRHRDLLVQKRGTTARAGDHGATGTHQSLKPRAAVPAQKLIHRHLNSSCPFNGHGGAGAACDHRAAGCYESLNTEFTYMQSAHRLYRGSSKLSNREELIRNGGLAGRRRWTDPAVRR